MKQRAGGSWFDRLGARTISLGPLALAALVFACAFGLYSATQGPGLVGYEPETAWVAEGFVRTGDFIVPSDAPFALGESGRGRDGKRIGRAGLPQDLLEVPFASVGYALDRARSSSADPRLWRDRTVLFFNPTIAALSVPGGRAV